MTGAAIAGLGITELGKVYGRSATSLAADAVRLAVADAGLRLRDVDGLLVGHGMSQDVGVSLASVLALGELDLLAEVSAFGATAGVMVTQATQAIAAGAATTVACVFADTPLKPRDRAGAAWGGSLGRSLRGLSGWSVASGAVSPNILYALCARRHMERYGTTSEQLGAIAVAQRAWAAGNPRAAMREPLTVAEHQASRWIAEPLHLLDCCLVSNGAVAVVVTGADRAAGLRQRPVHVWGYGQAHAPRQMRAGSDWGLVTPAVRTGPQAMRMAASARTMSTSASSTTATPTRSWSRWRITGSAPRAREVRSPPTAASAGREARLQHWRGPALRLLHVGDDAAVRGRYPGARRGRGPAGAPQRRDPGQRQRRRAGASRHARAEPAPGQPERDRMSGPVFPAVERDEASEPFFAAAARGQLLVRRCPSDGVMLGPQARTCPDCGGAELEWAAASGRGALVSWAVVHQVPVPALAAAVPYLTAVVELAEGPWLMARLVDADDRDLRAGLPVTARFLPSGGDSEPAGETLVAFAPRGAPA